MIGALQKGSCLHGIIQQNYAIDIEKIIEKLHKYRRSLSKFVFYYEAGSLLKL